jgi:TnpA family transposase
MPIEFLTDEQAEKYGLFVGVPSRAQLERYFFFNDADRALIEQRRRDHNRLGFGVQLGTVRFLGVFLSDPLDVPEEVLGYVAGQLEPQGTRPKNAMRRLLIDHAVTCAGVSWR